MLKTSLNREVIIDATSLLTIFIILSWVLITVLLNILYFFTNIDPQLFSTIARFVSYTNILAIPLAIGFSYIQRVKYLKIRGFFEKEYSEFFKEHNTLDDPLARKALKTNIGRFIDQNSQRFQHDIYRSTAVDKVNLTLSILIGLNAILFFTQFSNFQWFMFWANSNHVDTLTVSKAFVVDFNTIVIPPTIMLWFSVFFQIKNKLELDKFCSNIFNHFKRRSMYNDEQMLKAREEILRYYNVKCQNELIGKILSYRNVKSQKELIDYHIIE